MVNTTKLGVPLLAADQSQKHVTHNEALNHYDQMVQQTVINRSTTAPPGSPSEGDAYIIAATATGDWAGRETEIAAYINGEWIYFTPREGWRVYDEAADDLVVYDGSAWSALIGNTGDGTVRFATGVNSGHAAVGDDTVLSIDIERAGGLFLVWITDDPFPEASAGRFAFFYYDVGDSLTAASINLDASVTLTTGTPTGTTGADVSVNIFVDTRTIHIENRRGGTRTYRWLILN